MKPLVKAGTVMTLMATGALFSGRAALASTPDNAASSTQTIVKTEMVSSKNFVKTSNTKPKVALTFSVSTSKKVYKAGEPVVFTMTLRNVSRSDQVLKFSTGSSFDVVVSPQNRSTPVWQWSHGRMFTQVMSEVPLPAGASRVFTATWNRTGNNGKLVSPGKYRVAALLTTIGAGVEAPPIVFTLK